MNPKANNTKQEEKCCFRSKSGWQGDIHVCGRKATHKHVSGLGLCEKHFNRTGGGVKTTKSYQGHSKALKSNKP